MAQSRNEPRRPAAPAAAAGPLAVQDARQPARLAPIPIGPWAGILPPEQLGAAAEKVLGRGNLAEMTPGERARYLVIVCQLLRLNPLTRPFEIITFKDQTVLYARKEATEQIARNYGVSTEVRRRERDEVMGLYCVEVRASYRTEAGDERHADAVGAVPYMTASGELVPVVERANVVKKAETQARRRAVLGLLGLGIFDRAGERDPDMLVDGRGAIRARAPAGALPESSKSTAELFADEAPDTDHGGPTVRAERAAADARAATITPTDDEVERAAAEVAAEQAARVRTGVEYDGETLVVRAGGRSIAQRALDLSAETAAAVGSVLSTWLAATGAAPPEPPAADAGDAAWSRWHDAVLDLIERGRVGG